MELIIDSSNIEQIKELNELLTITGVTTNPTILTRSGREAMDVVKDLCEVLSEDQLLFIQTVQTSFEGIMEEAKMTANMEAKKIVVKTIQRVATETATENAVSIFHIDSDEIKGRIIGREGRNIGYCHLYSRSGFFSCNEWS